MLHTITDWLSRASGPAIYAVIFAIVFCEDALFFGFFLPGETAAVLGGVLAGQGKVSVYWLAALVVLAAVAGDSVGYEIGRRYGSRILDTRALRGHHQRIEKAEELIRRRGPTAVFLGRFIAFFRALMPALAGISRMPYRVFLAFNALGGVVWGVGFVLLGYFAGAAYERVERTAGTAVAIAVAAVAVVGFAVWEIRRRRHDRGATDDTDDDAGAADRADGADTADSADGAGEHDGKGAGDGPGRAGRPGEPEDPDEPGGDGAPRR